MEDAIHERNFFAESIFFLQDMLSITPKTAQHVLTFFFSIITMIENGMETTQWIWSKF